ncbi:MAG: 2-amino-4-hydroxy-6-hydroxymethyldihydropteridine diphosphokinase [Alistipes sp.]|nr:2-amino-4-hydroxy-6-hydroxymethyldihydropteridine diphosphokinase [Alistipes sp.]
MRVALLTGSNAPDRETILQRTAELLVERIGRLVAHSAIYTSSAWGFRSERDFANQALLLETELEPEQVLDEALAVEQIVGRDREAESRERALTGERYASRVVDVDIILCEDRVISTPRLRVPHPLMHEREFVLRPLCEIMAAERHPLLGRTIEELYNALKTNAQKI